MKFANLHLHSHYSDATFTPYQLALIGKCLGYGALALTDHETDGGVKEFARGCEKLGLQSLYGVEFYGRHDGHCLHLVALDYDYDDPTFRAFVKERCELYTECTRKRVERGIRIGYIKDFTWNDVLDYARDGSWICIDHVINAMKFKKVMDPTDDGEDLRRNVFKGPEAKSYQAPDPTAEQVIKVIRKAGGIAILAHPANQTQYVPELVNYGLNGIEICHPLLDGGEVSPAAEAAKTFRLYRSGGTDHTGAMSSCGGSNAVPALHGIDEEDFYVMKERRLG